jgi:glycosyltransferase involved in cell wall biosynthesis
MHSGPGHKKRHDIVVVAPTFNNERTVIGVVNHALEKCGRIVVVDDGSTDGTPALLEDWKREHPDDSVMIVRHEINRGKAEALKTGFALAKRSGHTHALTIDTDGQHDPDQILDFMNASEANPESIILGERDMKHPDYPAGSRFGRWLSDLATRLETGRLINDTQCGFRIYPLSIFETITCCMGRYAFEPEILTRAIWGGAGIRNIPVKCIYKEGDERISHLHPFYDGLLGAFIHFRLLGRTLIPIAFPKVPDAIGPESTTATGSGLSKLAAWLSPRNLWRQIRSDPASRSTVAAGVGLGAFIGSLPCFGLHAILGLYLAKRLKLHPLTVVAGTQISMPPFSPLIVFASIWVGFILLHFKIPVLTDFTDLSMSELFGQVVLEWTIGSIVVGAFLGVIMGTATSLALRLIPEKK